ncbi:MAG: leucine-rich repeat domain-containing protein [Oscillospiraceae bacterium]|jgi:Leucine-rich repeat (LRR) protein
MKLLKVLLALVLLAIIACGFIYFFRDDLMAEIWTKLGDRAAEKGNIEAAVSCYRRSVDRVSDQPELYLAIANYYIDNSDYTKAEQTLYDGIRSCPSSSALYIRLSAAFVEQDKLLDAAILLDSVADPDAKAEIEKARPAAPILSPAPGVYNEYISVAIDSDVNCLYSVGGDYPSTSGSVYSGPITLGDGVTEIIAIAVDEYGAVSSMVRAEYEVKDVIQVVTFEDQAMEKAARRALGKAAGLEVISTEAAAVTALEVGEADGALNSLGDLHWFPELTELTLKDQKNLDWSQLRQLGKLKSLTLESCDISTQDLDIISEIGTLEILRLPDNSIAGLSALTSLGSLKELNLSENSLSDITPLSEMNGLIALNLRENAVGDLSPLSNILTLERLDLEDNVASDLGPLSGLSALSYLNITRCPVADISPIGGCDSMKTLVANFCGISELSALSACKELETLEMENNLVSDISPLTELTGLKRLNLNSNNLSLLPDMSGMSSLEACYMNHNFISEVRAFIGCPSLTKLDLDYNQLTSVAGLKGCPRLQKLYCFGNNVSDSGELTGVTVYG